MALIHCLFEWSERDHSLREVVEVFQRQLPIMATVSEGYSGRDGMHEFASDEVYWIFDVQKQEKVVAKAALERYLSIPVDYPILFQKIINGKPTGSSMSMCSIINEDDFRGQKIRFKDDIQVPFNFGAKDGSFEQFGEMEIIESYSEKYLLCHSIVKKEIHPLMIGIPAYVPIRMEVAHGFTYGTREQFDRWMKDVAEISKNLENGNIIPRQEILLFHESPGGDYEYISPLKFTAHPYADDESEEEEDNDIPVWQLPPSAMKNSPKKCYTVARNPIKVCIQPVSLPSIPGPGLTREAFAKATRSGIGGLQKIPSHFAKTRGQPVVLPRSAATLPPKSSLGFSAASEPPLLPPKTRKNSSTTLPPKSGFSQSKEMKQKHLVKWGRSLDEKELQAPESSFQRRNSQDQESYRGSYLQSRSQSLQNSVSHNQNSVTLTSSKKRTGFESKMSNMLHGNQTMETAASKFSNPRTQHGSFDGSSNSKVSDWKTLDDVPENLDISQLSVDGVVRCLELLNLHSFVSFFRQMTVDGQMLLQLDKAMLVDDFGLSKLDALRLMMFVNKWRPNFKHDA